MRCCAGWCNAMQKDAMERILVWCGAVLRNATLCVCVWLRVCVCVKQVDAE